MAQEQQQFDISDQMRNQWYTEPMTRFSLRTAILPAVVRGGFEYQGRPYRSLSGVATALTGSHLNGPAFFGLRKPERKGA